MCHNLLIHFAVVDIFVSVFVHHESTTMNIPEPAFGENTYAFLMGLYLGVEFLVQMVYMSSALVDTASFPKWIFQFTLPAENKTIVLHPCQ